MRTSHTAVDYPMIELEVKIQEFPSENSEKIAELFSNIYPFAEITHTEKNPRGTITHTGTAQGLDSLRFFFEQARKQRTVEAIRQHILALLENEDNPQTVFFLIHKQALTQKKIVICKDPEESPLGPVIITLKSEELYVLINYLFPPTEKGKVIESPRSPTR